MAVKRRPANTQLGATTATQGAFSPRSNAIHSLRSKAKDGKVERALGKRGPFTDDFKDLIRSDYEQILEAPYLIKELLGAKKILKALAKRSSQPEFERLFHKISAYVPTTKQPSMLSPIWRHENCIQVLTALGLRYIYPEVRHEAFFVTIIFGYAQNLDELGQLVDQCRRDLDTLVKKSTARRRGLVLAGAFEPDLRSYDELTKGNPALVKISMQISYLPRQPTELMPAKAIRTNRRDLLQCPIGAPNLKQPSAHPQRMHPLSANRSFALRAANGCCEPILLFYQWRSIGLEGWEADLRYDGN